jgi:DNA/RNA endonuclease YhcR with UshA esterase domain
MRLPISALAVALLSAAVVAADEPAKPVTPEEAAKKVNENVTVEMEVKSARLQGNCYLNSQADYKDAKNFTVFIGRDALKKFKDAKIEDPAAHFKGKTVRVKGTVKLFHEKPEIVLDGPDQIQVVEKK